MNAPTSDNIANAPSLLYHAFLCIVWKLLKGRRNNADQDIQAVGREDAEGAEPLNQYDGVEHQEDIQEAPV